MSDKLDKNRVAAMDLCFSKFSDIFDSFASTKQGKATEVRSAIRNIKVGIKCIEKNLGLNADNRVGVEESFGNDYKVVSDCLDNFIELGKLTENTAELEHQQDLTDLWFKILEELKLGYNFKTWESFCSSRTSENVLIRDIITFIAYSRGYHPNEAAEFFLKDRSTVLSSIKRIQETVVDKQYHPKSGLILNYIEKLV